MAESLDGACAALDYPMLFCNQHPTVCPFCPAFASRVFSSFYPPSSVSFRAVRHVVCTIPSVVYDYDRATNVTSCMIVVLTRVLSCSRKLGRPSSSSSAPGALVSHRDSDKSKAKTIP